MTLKVRKYILRDLEFINRLGWWKPCVCEQERQVHEIIESRHHIEAGERSRSNTLTVTVTVTVTVSDAFSQLLQQVLMYTYLVYCVSACIFEHCKTVCPWLCAWTYTHERVRDFCLYRSTRTYVYAQVNLKTHTNSHERTHALSLANMCWQITRTDEKLSGRIIAHWLSVSMARLDEKIHPNQVSGIHMFWHLHEVGLSASVHF